ncbi:DUF488 domain-containing protein [Marinospirillum perlucidum]|uniref:DUF488 domain-containing protein n=1 Tax=Marinospirillum perlucidum TaxID=1982602 RepID=UPI000DF28E68|nr:DUF488 family protein [Marinospirillum perlucidum]
MKYPVFIKWIYAPSEPEDGTRILVDRLWPHDRDRNELDVDHWWRDAAPSSALKRRLNREDIDWKEFARLYRNELYTRPEELRALRAQAQKGKVTLLALEREPEQSHAWLLKETLEIWKDPADEDNDEASETPVTQGG